MWQLASRHQQVVRVKRMRHYESLENICFPRNPFRRVVTSVSFPPPFGCSFEGRHFFNLGRQSPGRERQRYSPSALQSGGTVEGIMGCASSAPLVQQGLDAAKKAISREKDNIEAKGKSVGETMSESTSTLMDNVVHVKDEAVEKLEEIGESIKEKVEDVVEDIEDKVDELMGKTKEEVDDKKEELEEMTEAFDKDAEDKEAEEEQKPETPSPDATEESLPANVEDGKNKTPEPAKDESRSGSAATVVISSRRTSRQAHTPEVWSRSNVTSPVSSSDLQEAKQEIEQELKEAGVNLNVSLTSEQTRPNTHESAQEHGAAEMDRLTHQGEAGQTTPSIELIDSASTVQEKVNSRPQSTKSVSDLEQEGKENEANQRPPTAEQIDLTPKEQENEKPSSTQLAAVEPDLEENRRPPSNVNNDLNLDEVDNAASVQTVGTTPPSAPPEESSKKVTILVPEERPASVLSLAGSLDHPPTPYPTNNGQKSPDSDNPITNEEDKHTGVEDTPKEVIEEDHESNNNVECDTTGSDKSGEISTKPEVTSDEEETEEVEKNCEEKEKDESQSDTEEDNNEGEENEDKEKEDDTKSSDKVSINEDQRVIIEAA